MITNLQVLNRAETTNVAAMLHKAHFRWTEHVIRMEDTACRVVCFRESWCAASETKDALSSDSRTLKENLKWRDIKPVQLQSAAMQ